MKNMFKRVVLVVVSLLCIASTVFLTGCKTREQEQIEQIEQEMGW